MNKKVLIILLLVSTIGLSGCGTIKSVFTKGKSATSEEKSRAKVANVEQALINNDKDKLDELSKLTYGVGYA